MEQKTGLRQVSKQYNGIQLSASMLATCTGEIHHWSGTVEYTDGAPAKAFEFFQQGDQMVIQPATSEVISLPEIRLFANFCAEVYRAHI